MAANLEKMSLDELKKLKKDVEKAINSFEKRQLADARKAAEAAAKKFGVTLEELVKTPARKAAPKRKGAAKYKNPADAKQTWTGKGRQPQWFKDAIASGKSPDDMSV